VTIGLHVAASDPTPPYEQLRRQLVALIEAGTLGEGARLPPVRQLAADLALATGTVARTYRELEKAGVLRTRRGAGTTVAAGRQLLPDTARGDRIRVLAQAAVQRARLMGASDDEIRAAVELELRQRGATLGAQS
jgi:DNA-binding transcriptional regulator YhcF (GntR family)